MFISIKIQIATLSFLFFISTLWIFIFKYFLCLIFNFFCKSKGIFDFQYTCYNWCCYVFLFRIITLIYVCIYCLIWLCKCYIHYCTLFYTEGVIKGSLYLEGIFSRFYSIDKLHLKSFSFIVWNWDNHAMCIFKTYPITSYLLFFTFHLLIREILL